MSADTANQGNWNAEFVLNRSKIPDESDYRKGLGLSWSQQGLMQKELCHLRADNSSHCQNHLKSIL
jgi:hypothetical protein